MVSTSDKEDCCSNHGVGGGSLNNLIGAESEFSETRIIFANQEEEKKQKFLEDTQGTPLNAVELKAHVDRYKSRL
jgi:hypothetical protein